MKKLVKNILLRVLPMSVIQKLAMIKQCYIEATNEAHRLCVFCEFVSNYLIFGVSPEEYRGLHFARLRNREKRKFISFEKGKKIDKKVNNTESNCVLCEKHLFNEYFSNYIHRKWIRINGSETSELEIKIFFESLHGYSYIVKPDDMYYGFGVHKGKTLEELYKLKNEGKKYIVEEMLQNHEDLARINETSLNTLRVVTFIDKMGKVNILAIVLRVGAKGAVVDNAYSGGSFYHVNKISGLIDSRGVDVYGNEYIFHPSNEVFMLGYKIPMFETVKKMCVDLAQMLPGARYVGWDLAVTNKGVEVIEGNIRPSAAVTQCDGVGLYEYIHSLI